MAWSSITAGDFGFEGRLRVVQDDIAVDISTYTTLQFILRHIKTGTEKTVTASFLTTGVDGWLKYTFVDGDIDAAGDWSVQAVVSKTGARLTSDWHRFSVKA